MLKAKQSKAGSFDLKCEELKKYIDRQQAKKKKKKRLEAKTF